MSNAIELVDLTLRAGGQPLIEKANLSLAAESFTAILGASGSGKTTLLRAIAGFVTPSAGHVYLRGRNASNVPPEARDLSMLFQEPVLYPRLTVRENARVAMGGIPKNEANIRVTELARDFSIDRDIDRRVGDGLSGGERQRAALVRTFANDRDIVLLDEPLRSALNIELKWRLMRAIKKRAERRTTILVTHDFTEAAYFADKIVVVHDRSISFGPPREMYEKSPNLATAVILGPGNILPASLLRDETLREQMCPIKILGHTPETKGDTDWIFFRPNKVKLMADGGGSFEVISQRFLGDVMLVLVRARGSDQELEVHVGPTQNFHGAVDIEIQGTDISVFDPVGHRRTL